MMIVAKSTLPSYQARDIVDDQFAKRITQTTGMASVDIKVGRVREIHLDADPSGLIAHNLSLRRLATLVRDSNLNSPSGSIAQAGKETSIRIVGEPSSPKELGETGIPFGGGRVTRLWNVVRVVDGLADLDTDWKAGRFELRITPDQYRLSFMGVTLSQVAEELRGYLSEIKPGAFRGKRIRIRYSGQAFRQVDRIIFPCSGPAHVDTFGIRPGRRTNGRHYRAVTDSYLPG